MKNLIFLIAILVLVMIQVTLLDYVRIFYIKPDLLLIAMILSSVYLKKWWGVSIGVLTGAIKDIFSVNVFGINAVLFFLWSLLLVKLSKKISIDNSIVFMLVVFIVAVLNSIIIRVIFLYLGKSIPLGIFLRIMILESLCTALVSPLLFRPAKWLELN